MREKKLRTKTKKKIIKKQQAREMRKQH